MLGGALGAWSIGEGLVNPMCARSMHHERVGLAASLMSASQAMLWAADG